MIWPDGRLNRERAVYSYNNTGRLLQICFACLLDIWFYSGMNNVLFVQTHLLPPRPLPDCTSRFSWLSLPLPLLHHTQLKPLFFNIYFFLFYYTCSVLFAFRFVREYLHFLDSFFSFIFCCFIKFFVCCAAAVPLFCISYCNEKCYCHRCR